MEDLFLPPAAAPVALQLEPGHDGGDGGCDTTKRLGEEGQLVNDSLARL